MSHLRGWLVVTDVKVQVSLQSDFRTTNQRRANATLPLPRSSDDVFRTRCHSIFHPPYILSGGSGIGSIREDSILLVWNIRGPNILSLQYCAYDKRAGKSLALSLLGPLFLHCYLVYRVESARLHYFSSRHSAVARIAAASSPSTNRLQ